MKIIQIPMAYSAAVLMAYLVGCLVISQSNIAAVTGMGFEITLSQRWQTAIHDIANMTNLYLPLIAVAYLIALPVTAGVIRVASAPRLLGYLVGGFVALVAIHVAIKLLLGMSGIAPTRTLVGLCLQGFAGAAGGYCFYKLTARAPEA